MLLMSESCIMCAIYVWDSINSYFFANVENALDIGAHIVIESLPWKLFQIPALAAATLRRLKYMLTSNINTLSTFKSYNQAVSQNSIFAWVSEWKIRAKKDHESGKLCRKWYNIDFCFEYEKQFSLK